MSRSADPRPALEALMADPAGDPLRRALWLDALDRRLRPCLPPAIAAHARLANLTGTTLVFVVDSPAWHARVRLAEGEIALFGGPQVPGDNPFVIRIVDWDDDEFDADVEEELSRPSISTQNELENLAVLLGSAGVNYIMGIPMGDDSMLSYQSSSYHDAPSLRQLLNLRPLPEFEAWMEGIGLLKDGRLTEKAGDASFFLSR